MSIFFLIIILDDNDDDVEKKRAGDLCNIFVVDSMLLKCSQLKFGVFCGGLIIQCDYFHLTNNYYNKTLIIIDIL